MKPKLKIGLLLDGTKAPYWASKTIQRIQGSDYAEIVLLIMDEGTESSSRQSARSALYRMYARYDRATHRSGTDPLVLEDLPAGLEKADRVYLGGVKEHPPAIPQDALTKITGWDLDVLIAMGDMIPPRELSKCSRYGVLSFSLGDGATCDGSDPGLWEVLEGAPLTGSQVRRFADGSCWVVYRSYSHTVVGSAKVNREMNYHKGISFIPRVLKALYRGDEDALSSIACERYADDGCQARGEPGSMDMIRHFARRIPNEAGFLTKRALFEERWAIRFQLGKEVPASFEGLTTLVPPRHTWWADPIAARQDDDLFIFVEELVLPKSKHPGHISVVKLNENGKPANPVKVLERPYHLSYPFVFRWEDRHYMVPESSANRTIELYEADEFPYTWHLVKELMTDVLAVDTTLLRRNGRWWLFCNMVENEGSSINDELFLFHSDNLVSDRWVPHPLNPIVSDVRNARPAGGIFEQDGVLYRPAQDCSVRYGYAVNINKIVEMDEQHYREALTNRIEPGAFPGASAVHTLSHVPGLTVVDTLISRPRIAPGS